MTTTTQLPDFRPNDVLIVVDMQHDFVDGVLGTKEAQNIQKPIQQRIRQFLENHTGDANDELIFTMDTHTDDYMNTIEGKHLPVPHCIMDTDGWQSVYPDEIINGVFITKETFGSNKLGQYLQQLDEKYHFDENTTIELIGVCTDICVIANAIVAKTFLPNVNIRVVESLCAGTTPENHVQALTTMGPLQIETI